MWKYKNRPVQVCPWGITECLFSLPGMLEVCRELPPLPWAPSSPAASCWLWSTNGARWGRRIILEVWWKLETEDEKWQMRCTKVPSPVVPWEWKGFAPIMWCCLFKVTLKNKGCEYSMVWSKVIVVKIYSLLIFQLFPAPIASLGSWDFSHF